MPHTPRLRRSALTVVVALCASLFATAVAASPASAAPPTYVVAGDDPNQTGEFWGLHESYFRDLRSIITNTTNFGPTGTVRATFTIANARTVPLNANSLNGIDVYFLSGRDLQSGEQAVLNTFVANGGAVITSSNGPSFFDTTTWLGFGLSDRNVYGDNMVDTTHRAPSPSAVVAAQVNHPIMNGPFGSVTTFDNWHSVAGFTSLPATAVGLARSPLTFPGSVTNPVTLAAIPAGALGASSGPIVATSDIDTFSNAYTVSAAAFHPGDDTNTLNGTGNGVLARNAFAWIAAEKMQQDGITSGYVSLTNPVRALDTRSTGPLGGQVTRELSLTGAGVPVNATMVAVNVTAVDPTGSGFLTVWPADSALPEVSNVNFVAGTTVANAAFVKLGANARISIYNSSGSTHVLIDVVGYVASNGSRLVNVGPTRIKDTRSNLGGSGQASTNETQTLQVAGTGAVPNGATGVILNVTAVDPTATAYLTVWPAGQAQPTGSNINTVAGTTVANLVVVRLPTSGGTDVVGRINLYNAAGSTQILVDVLGYYTNAAAAGSVTAETPHRQLDTRVSGSSLGAGETRTIGTGLSGATAVIINVTAVDPTATGYLTVFPADRSQPDASNVNFYAGRNAPNLVVVHSAADGSIKIFNSAGATHVLVDVIGRFDG